MEAASEIRKNAFLGDYLPCNCGVAAFTWGVPFAVQREFLRPKPRLGKGGKVKGKAAD